MPPLPPFWRRRGQGERPIHLSDFRHIKWITDPRGVMKSSPGSSEAILRRRKPKPSTPAGRARKNNENSLSEWLWGERGSGNLKRRVTLTISLPDQGGS